MARKTSPWLYVALGCGVAVFLVAAAVVTVSWVGYRWAKGVEKEMKDPTQRAARVASVLGVQEIPQGYYPVVAVSVPWVMDMAMLGDHPPKGNGRSGDLGDRGFIFISARDFKHDKANLRAYLQGKKTDASSLRDLSLHIDTQEELARGSFQRQGATFTWAAHRGSVATQGHGGGRGVESLVLVDCPKNDGRMRFAVWFGPDPAPQTDAKELNLAGTPADGKAVEAFLGQFHLCPAPAATGSAAGSP